MPMKNKKNPTPFNGVVQMPLDPSSEAQIIEMSTDAETLVDYLEILAQTKHAVSIGYDADFEVFSVCVRCNNPDSPNYGFWFYANGEVPTEVLAAALYKHFILSNSGKWTGNTERVKKKFS